MAPRFDMSVYCSGTHWKGHNIYAQAYTYIIGFVYINQTPRRETNQPKHFEIFFWPHMIRILLPANINFSTPTAKAKAILREYFPRISKHPTFSICFRHNTRACAMFSESSENKLSSEVHLVAVELKFWRKIRILTNLTAEEKKCFSLPTGQYPGYPVKRKTVQF